MLFISKDEQESLKQYLKTLTLLYVEDDEFIRQSFIPVLQRRVGKLITAENGMEGLDSFYQHKPDLVISDVKMPHMTGLEMIQAIRDCDSDVPVILTTAFRESDYFLQAIEYDVDEYILKPINTTLLSRVLLKCSKLLKDRRYAKIARATFESINSCILITNQNHQIISVNPKFKEIFNYSIEDVYLKDISFLNAGKQDYSFYEKMYIEISDLGFWEGEIWNRTRLGTVQTQWMTVQPSSKDMKQLNYIYILSNLTSHNIEKNHLEYQAYHDFLTGLPNRHLFLDRLEESIAFSERYHKKLALLFLDLNKFKPVNDEYGHHVGDLLLQQVASRLTECVNVFDTVARLGGDEFVIILTDIENQNTVELIAKQICNHIKKPFKISKKTEMIINISTSIGISIYPEHTISMNDLVHYADKSMYIAKKNQLGFKTYESSDLDNDE